MSPFHYRDGVLHAERVPLPAIAASIGTPAYVYSTAAFRASARAFRAGLAPIARQHVAFAVKANPNLAILRLLAAEGYGADIVSHGEMLRALAAGIPARAIVFSGVGKTDAEMIAALDAGVGQFNVEFEEEGVVLAGLAAARGRRAVAVLRVNPDIDAGTHAKISTGRRDNKFGVGLDDAPGIYARLARLDGLDLRGVAIHIGSQIADLAPLEAAISRIGTLIADLRAAGHRITHVDLGGGLGIPYRPEEIYPTAAAYGAMVARVTRDWDATLMFEPGRFVAGEAGVLLTEILWVKPGAKHPYVIVDAAMNDLARPALYDAFHDFIAVEPNGRRMVANIAGPVCESGDTFAMGRAIDEVRRGDLAVFRTVGAYGATMASTYNCRPLIPEVLVDDDRFTVVADRISPQATLDVQPVAAWRRPILSLARQRR
ncbi:diaminopimelate decarboxylase [Sphingomonas sp. PP-CE-3G-477]|uniref:diaminopimelate decarboxylase n=1 Tax=Sphingomonas sp. PP-CE-3G-477 TaxID=2135660 RepID=UPI000D3D4D92|nr:diaminopimelate decarboxylase [Sphingomonas sp. PP-CE-3G-477]PTQ64664.1 diaminopimelate decarboxylase [Sphingomonas sp. PP-CE-3G-477]